MLDFRFARWLTLPLLAGLHASWAAQVTTDALVRLRDIGGVGSGLSISPNARYIVYEVHQAQPEANSYLNQWVLIDLKSKNSRVVIPDAGEAIQHFREGGYLVGDDDDVHHYVAVLTPAWTPESEAFYYVRQDRGQLSLHRFAVATNEDRAIATPAGEIVDLRSLNAREAILSIRINTADAIASSQQRRKEGMLFTGSELHLMHGDAGLRPQFTSSFEKQDYILQLEDGRLSRDPAPIAEDQKVGVKSPLEGTYTRRAKEYPGAVVDLISPMLSPDKKRIAWMGSVRDPQIERSYWGTALFESRTGENELVMISPIAENIFLQPKAIGWSADSRYLYFIRPQETQNDIFEADVKASKIRRVTHSGGVLDTCAVTTTTEHPTAACTIEFLQRPPEVASIDLRTGELTVLTNLNPEYNMLEKARANPVIWKNRLGDEHFGMLTYPLYYREGQRFPIIVTHYYHPGFQRGSNGDEYPIQVFAANGFFVLDYFLFRKNLDNAHIRPDPFDREVYAATSMRAAVEDLVKDLARAGMVDSDAVGMGGLSAGSAFTADMISHSALVRAAVIDHLAYDPMWLFYLSSASFREEYAQLGITPDRPDRWKQAFVAPNVHDITAALLINTDDHEFLTVMQSYWAMRDSRKPVEMWIFNDEFHAKWQPIHRLTIYNRNVDWFRFWLQGYEDTDPLKADQYRRWEKLCDMKAEVKGAESSQCVRSAH